MKISQSDVVRVRRRRWRVVDVRSYDRCQVLTLVGIEPNASHQERRFIAPFDLVERIERRTRPVRVPRRFWRRACRGLIAAHTPPGALACARLARIDLLPHQLAPALALVRGLGSRVLLADDVGLGKTIQAGLIVSELRALGAADRVLIVTPAGLREQWAHELSERFNTEPALLDVRALRRSAAVLPIGLNPWQTAPIAITSIDYIKRIEVLTAARACRWDLLVVDEAHGVAGDSDRHAAVAALAAQAAYVVLLTATPHNGDRATFLSLCGIGAGPDERLMVFRRTRQDVALGTVRRIHRLHVRMSRDEARMHALLRRLSRTIRQQHEQTRPGHDFWLALSVLHKRALSSARSLQRSIDRRLAMLSVAADLPSSQLQLPLGDLAGELTPADESPEWSPLLGLADAACERDLLDALARAAARAAQHETKIAATARLLRRVHEPAIVFTEFRDTLLHVKASLGLPAATLHGGMTREERSAAIRQFMDGGRLLLATDAAGEGLNLQRTCRFVINLELPWNPMRLEQRIGRVDRIGQRRPVHVVHLIARGSGESQVLSRLQSRVARARADIGGADPLGAPPGDAAEVGADVITHVWGRPSARPIRLQPDPAIEDIRPNGGRSDQAVGAQPAATLWTPSLERDAQAEASRIAVARRLAKAGDEQALARLECLGPSIARVHSSHTRAELRGRTTMLWQIVAADASGRVVGSTIVPVMVADGRRHDDDEILRRVEHAAEAWRDAVTTSRRRLMDARLARERATEARLALSDGLSDLFQPGLFERRGELAHSIASARRDAADRDSAERIAALDAAVTISFLPPQLQLVLTP